LHHPQRRPHRHPRPRPHHPGGHPRASARRDGPVRGVARAPGRSRHAVMRIVVAGIMGRYPYGGVQWCSLMYLKGLRQLGHEVWYLEDTGECNYDPEANTLATDPAYALGTLARALEPAGFGDRWCYIDYTGRHHGMTEARWREMCARTDLYLNLSGGSWFWRDEYSAIPHSAFIDSDPGFTQLAIASGPDWYVDFFRRFDTLFTFGANIGTKASSVETGDLRWHHT